MPCFWICNFTKDYNDELRKWWEEWDLRILILPILVAQLYLHFFGPRRINSTVPYLFADLLATIALGKLSKVDVEYNDGYYALRVMWAPLILFYLGGPDTITVLDQEENKLWVKHLIGLLTQGLRTAYALMITWSDGVLSLLALLVFIPGIIKYGERVWVIRKRSKDYKGCISIDIDLHTISKNSASRPNAESVLLAYSWFTTLMPHHPRYKYTASKVRNLVTRFCESVGTESFDAFKLIEIELGLIYDMPFSKVGTIFTVWGSILRFLSFSLIVSSFVVYLACDKPHGHLKADHVITIILIAGAIFLEIAGIVVQLVSDWALVWACWNRSGWATPVLFLNEFLSSKIQRQSGVMGQFSLCEFCTNYKPTVCNKTREHLFGREKMLKRFSSQPTVCNKTREYLFGKEKMLKRFSSQKSQHLKDLIICHLREKSKKAAVVDTLQTSPENVANVDKLKRGEWTLVRFGPEQQLKWSIELEFGQSIVIWHVATEVCYKLDHPEIDGKAVGKVEAAKILSNYMMYLLVACHSTFPFCYEYAEIMKDHAHMKEFFEAELSRPKEFENEGYIDSILLVNKAQRLVQDMKGNPKRWDIMGSMWVEMLCNAVVECPVANHIQGLRHGGEFLTHVWLLLMHFGMTLKLERSASSLMDEFDGGRRAIGGSSGEIEADQVDRGQYHGGGIQATAEELKENRLEGWTSTWLS